MHVTSSVLTAAHLRHCLPWWSDRAAYSAAELERAVVRAGALLDQDAARGVLISEPGGRPRAYGITVFVHEQFADAYVNTPHPLVGRRLLLHDEQAILTADEDIGRRNASSGLQMVVVGQSWDDRGFPPESFDGIVSAMVAGFFEMHRGFRLERIINEVIGDRPTRDVEASEAFAHYYPMEHVTPCGTSVRTLLAVIDRREATARRGLLMPMFTYAPPQVGFTRAERQLLRAALHGGTDKLLAERLGVPMTAVKARWNRIQERVMARLPELLPAGGTTSSPTRGAQVRHLILEFVRAHPSELTPYVEPARDTSRFHPTLRLRPADRA